MLAEQDLAFIARDKARGLRLQMEYLKPEFLLQEHAIADTVVVYGSTRIQEPAAAGRSVEAARQALEVDPRNNTLIRKLAVAERILAKSRYYEVARAFGHLVGSSRRGDGSPSSLVIMTGGGPGMMEAANRGACEAGAKSIGLNIRLPHEQYPNPYITPDLCFQFHYFALRKMHFLLRARAVAVFPGGYGTLDEMMELLTLTQTQKLAKKVTIILYGSAYWKEIINFEALVKYGMVSPEDLNLFQYADDPNTAFEILKAGLMKYALQVDSPETPAISKSRIPQKPSGA